jgi:Fe-S cluster assembly iron-binding protein IscA
MNIKVTSDAIAQLKDRYNNADRAFRVMINGFG